MRRNWRVGAGLCNVQAMQSMPTDESTPTRVVEDVVIGTFGIVTSVATAALLAWIQHTTGMELYTWSFLFIIPAGALFSGFAAASGYYAGARLFDHRPSKRLLWAVGGAAVTTFFLVHFFVYWTMEENGKLVRDLVSFDRYLDLSIRSASLSFGLRGTTFASTGELGLWGYPVALVQIAGFTFGGLAVYGYLKSVPYCENCRRYFSSKGRQQRFSQNVDAALASADQILVDFKAGAFGKAVAQHAVIGNAKHVKKTDRIRSTVELRHCKGCQQHWANFLVENKPITDWREIKASKFEGRTNEILSTS